MFERFFVDKHNLTTLEVFRALKRLGPHNATVNRLKDITNLPYATTYKALQEIDADLLDILPKDAPAPNEETSQILGESISINCFRFAMLVETVSYQFFDEIFLKGEIDAADFCSRHNISATIMKKRVETAASYLEGSGVTITPEGKLTGPELQIRLAMMAFYQLSYRGVGWPFDAERYQQALAVAEQLQGFSEPWFNPSPYHTKQELIRLAVQNIRIEQGHALTEDITPFDGEKFFNKKLDPLIFTSDNYPQLTQAELIAERDYYHFARLYSYQDRTVLSEQDLTLVSLLKTEHPQLAQFVADFIDYLERYEKMDSHSGQTREAIEYNLLCSLLIYEILGPNYSRAADFGQDDPALSTSNLVRIIDEYIEEVVEESHLPDLPKIRKSLVTTLFSLVYTVFPKLNNDRKLHTAILIDGGTPGTRDLIYNLTHLSFLDFIPDSDFQATKPDVIVTTLTAPGSIQNYFPEDVAEKTPILTWDNDNPTNDFLPFSMQLRRLLDQKLRQ